MEACKNGSGCCSGCSGSGCRSGTKCDSRASCPGPGSSARHGTNADAWYGTNAHAYADANTGSRANSCARTINHTYLRKSRDAQTVAAFSFTAFAL